MGVNGRPPKGKSKRARYDQARMSREEEAYRLRDKDGLTTEQIAARMEVTDRQVRTYLAKARARRVAMFSEDDRVDSALRLYEQYDYVIREARLAFELSKEPEVREEIIVVGDKAEGGSAKRGRRVIIRKAPNAAFLSVFLTAAQAMAELMAVDAGTFAMRVATELRKSEPQEDLEKLSIEELYERLSEMTYGGQQRKLGR